VTVRQLYYRAEVEGLPGIDKTAGGYDKIQRQVLTVTAAYDVPLMVARGFSSETFCFEAIEARSGDARPYIVYYLGDFDRAGQDAAASLREKLKRFARGSDINIEFVHLAIAEDDIIRFDAGTGLVHIRLGTVDRRLPTREPKRKSRNDQGWPYPFACELDAIEPDDLRALVRQAIEQHLPKTQLKMLKIAEQSERELIAGLVGKITSEPVDPHAPQQISQP
jgi:hypothetical protein